MTEKTMTVKQIAEAIGKKERNIHNWITKLSVKNAEIYAKIAEAKRTSKPAEYTLKETISIIEIGHELKKAAKEKAKDYDMSLAGLIRKLLVKFIKNPDKFIK